MLEVDNIPEVAEAASRDETGRQILTRPQRTEAEKRRYENLKDEWKACRAIAAAHDERKARHAAKIEADKLRKAERLKTEAEDNRARASAAGPHQAGGTEAAHSAKIKSDHEAFEAKQAAKMAKREAKLATMVVSIPDLTAGELAIEREGDAAGERLSSTRQWADWIAVGKLLKLARDRVMLKYGLQHPEGYVYRHGFSEWLNDHAWAKEMHGNTRADALWVMSNLTELEAWRAKLDGEQRELWNHPTIIKKRYLKGKDHKSKSDKTKVDDDKQKRLRPELEQMAAQCDQSRHEAVVARADNEKLMTAAFEDAGRIEKLERQLENANAEIARLKARVAELEKATPPGDFVVMQKATKTKGEVRHATPETIAAYNAKLRGEPLSVIEQASVAACL